MVRKPLYPYTLPVETVNQLKQGRRTMSEQFDAEIEKYAKIKSASGQKSMWDESKHPRADDGRFGSGGETSTTQEGGATPADEASMEPDANDEKEPDYEFDGEFRKTKSGIRVFKMRKSHHDTAKPGDTILGETADGYEESFQVHSVGSDFMGRDGKTYLYLYLEDPSPRTVHPSPRTVPLTHDPFSGEPIEDLTEGEMDMLGEKLRSATEGD